MKLDMKLIAEKDETDVNDPWRIFVEDERGKHPVDLGLHNQMLCSAHSGKEVQFRILRPTGFFNWVLRETKLLYIQIKANFHGTKIKGFLWSRDQGRTWGQVKRMGTNTAETIDVLTIRV